MDQRLLDALNNLSFALEEIAEAINSKSSPSSDTATALSSGNFSTILNEINIGVKSIKKDTQEILNKQDTIIELSKSKESSKPNAFEEAGDPKKTDSIKKGVGTILLIAVGVLAIGAAFKLVGNINFLSVIGLGVGIYMVSLAFERVARLDIDVKRAGLASLFMVMASGAILASSMILSKVKTISFGQIISIASIATLFHFVMPVMVNMMNSISSSGESRVSMPGGKVITTKGLPIGKLALMVASMPLLMIGMSLGIMVASNFLNQAKTLSLGQIVSIGAIALLFHFVIPVMANVMGVLSGTTKAILPDGTVLEKTDLSFGKLLGMVVGLPLLMIGMSIGIMVSSKILSSVTPISLTKLFTAVAIAGMFSLVASGVTKLLGVFFNSGFSLPKLIGAIVVLPIMLLGISIGIMLSSYVLDKVKPIGILQAISSILIAGVFSVISMGIGKLVSALASIGNPMKILFAAIAIPLILPALALGIMISSHFLDKVKPIGFAQFVTSIAIAAVFIVFGLTIRALGKSIGNVTIGSVIKIPLLFTALSLAVMLSSEILSKVVEIPYAKMLNILAFSVVLGIAMIVMAFASKLVNKFGNVISYIKSGLSIIALCGIILMASAVLSNYKEIETSKLLNILLFSATLAISVILLAVPIYLISKFLKRADVIEGTLSLIMISAAIATSSMIISSGKYDLYPDWKWLVGAGLSIVAFGLIIVLFKYSNLKIGDVLKGSLIILAVATTIMATSHILNIGKYNDYPSIGWVLGTTLAIGLFSVGAFGLGMLVAGPQALFVLAGLGSILAVAGVIVGASHILSKGDYKSYPSSNWAKGVSYVLMAFVEVGLKSISVSEKKMKSAIISVSEAIYQSSLILSKGNYKSGPSKEWSSGVSMAIRSFMPIYDMIADSQSLFSSITGKAGITPVKFTKAISTVVNGIVSAANEFAKSPTVWKNGPTSEWSKGVSKSIKGFFPLYEMLVDSNSFMAGFTGAGGVTPKKFSNAIKVVSMGIMTAANEFAKSPTVWKNGPTLEWSKGVGKAIKGFYPVYEMLLDSNSFMGSITGSTGVTPKKFSNAIKVISMGIIEAAREFAKSPTVWKNGPTLEWSKGVGRAIKGFYPVYEFLQDSNSIFSAKITPKQFSAAIVILTKGIIEAANEFSKSPTVWKNGPTESWSKGVSAAISGFYPVYEILQKSKSIFAAFTGSSDITPGTYRKAIVTIIGGIVEAANELAKSPTIWKNGPTESWGKGVSAAISGFYPVYEVLQKSKSIFDSFMGKSITVDSYKKAIVTIIGGIVEAANELAKSPTIWKNGPTESWGKGVSAAINGFIPIYDIMQKSKSIFSFNRGIKIEEFKNGIKTLIGGILEAAKELGSDENAGIWKKGPTSEWSKMVSIAIGGFIPVYKLLQEEKSFWNRKTGQSISIAEYKNSIKLITSGIVAAAKELGSEDNKNIWKNGPTKEWGLGVSSAIRGFYPVYEFLLKQKGFFSAISGAKYVSSKIFKNAIITITSGIVEAARVLAAGGKNLWENAPPTTWVEGVSGAIEAFTPVYEILVKNSSLWSKITGTGVSIDTFKNAIETIVGGIVTAGKKMSGSGGVWNNPPTVAWVKGVGGAISAFTPVYKILSDNALLNIFGVGVNTKTLKTAIIAITDGIIESAKRLNNSNITFDSYPSVEWASGVSLAIKSFSPIFKSLHEDSRWFMSGEKVINNINYGITTVIDSIVSVNKKIYGMKWDSYPSPKWGENVKWAIAKYINAAKYISESDPNTRFHIKTVGTIFDYIIDLNNKLYGVSWDSYPSPKWGDSIKWSIQKYTNAAKYLSESGINTLYYNKSINSIFDSIVRINKKIYGLSWDSYPSMKWGDSIKWSIQKYTNAAKYLSDADFDPFYYTKSINSIFASIVKINKKITGLSWDSYPSMKWMDVFKLVVQKYTNAAKYLSDADFDPFYYTKSINSIFDSIVKINKKISGLEWGSYPSMKWMDAIKRSVIKYLGISKYIPNSDVDPENKAIISIFDGIVKINKKISGLEWNSYPSMEWMDAIKRSVIKYLGISKYVSNSDVDSGIGSIFDSIVKINKKISGLEWGSYPSMKWMDAIKRSVVKYLGISKYISNSDVDPDNKVISSIFDGIVKINKKISGLEWGSYPSMKWMDAIKRSVIKYLGISKYISNSDVDPDNKVISSIFDSIVKINKKLSSVKFNNNNLKWVDNLKGTIYKYLNLHKYIAYNKIDNFDSIDNIAIQMVNTGKILSSGKYLSKSINPDYMKNMSSNMKYYFEMIDFLNKSNKKTSKDAKSASVSMGVDNVATGIYKLSNAYDKLSQSINKFSKSINQLDPKSVNLFRGMTANIAMLSALDSKMFDNMLQVLESRSSVFAKLLSEQAGKNKQYSESKKTSTLKSKVVMSNKLEDKKGKYGTNQDQMDVMIELLAYIYKNFAKDSKFDKYLGKRIKQMREGESMSENVDESGTTPIV